MSLAVLYREGLKEYDFGAGHPFRGERYHTFYHFFKENLSDENYQIIDLHQDPRTLYPGTGFVHQIGKGEGKGYTINVPMPIDLGYESYKSVFEEIVEPVTKEFEPEIILSEK
jgi:acetoin utilization deacetylase AcuC-like enzyme